MADRLYLKWGTLKGWDVATDPFRDALQAYVDSGVSASAMLQYDTPDQVELLCTAIDACDGEIINDWSGEAMSKEGAKAYLREYPRKEVHG